ncbi:uncharacterized protein LOC126667249 [Mercurialis annua]|uniref:uncharacterized protein LOC126667249 n=1 Tax=Mercurialis annua TaxID=3986 RepID=UPI002160E5AF|nr:uncharacterized protein LOC126667249 [Mercurialis annua]
MSHENTTINNLALHTAKLRVSEPTLALFHEEVKEKLVLFGKFWGTKIFYPASVRETLARSWRAFSGLTVKKDASNVFIFTFSRVEDLERAWNGRPWCLSNNLLVLQRWTPDSSLESIDFSCSPFWVHAFGLPASQISKRNAALIGSLFEKMIGMDARDDGEGDLGSIMRVKVLVKVTEAFRRGFFTTEVNRKEKFVSFLYERFPDICFKCGLVGHYSISCSNPVEVATQEGVPDYGLWMRYGSGKLPPSLGSPAVPVLNSLAPPFSIAAIPSQP